MPTEQTVKILGSDWKIIRAEADCGGSVDYTAREIIINDKVDGSLKVEAVETSRILRHELIHAFLFESGLGFDSDWATVEEMVDWFAIQLPKIAKTFLQIQL